MPKLFTASAVSARTLAVIAIAVIVIVCLITVCGGVNTAAAAAAVANATIGGAKRPGPKPPASDHLVVDALNLTHWMHSTAGAPAVMTPGLIASVIDATAPTLRKRWKGRVMYVLKDRESQFNSAEAREVYRLAAVRNRVYVCVAERYADPPASAIASELAKSHSQAGRDDLYMLLLARRYRCPILTADKLRDFDKFRAQVRPFYAIEYAYWRDLPETEYVRPLAAARGLRRPQLILPDEVLDPKIRGRAD